MGYAKATAACLVGTCSSGLRGGPSRRAQSVRTRPSGRKQRPVPSALPCQPRPALGLCLSAVSPGTLSSQNYLFTREALHCAELHSGPSASEVTPFCITPPSLGTSPTPITPTLPGDLSPSPSPPPSLGTLTLPGASRTLPGPSCFHHGPSGPCQLPPVLTLHCPRVKLINLHLPQPSRMPLGSPPLPFPLRKDRG